MHIRLMTHNIWNRDSNSEKWAEKGLDCSAAARVSGLLRVYCETKPDVIRLPGGIFVDGRPFEARL